MASAPRSVEASIVRLDEGEAPRRVLDLGRFACSVQETRPGSYVEIPDAGRDLGDSSVTVCAWIYPTTPARGRPQGIVTKARRHEPTGWSLLLGDDGRLAFEVSSVRIELGQFMTTRWYFVLASFDGQTRRLRLGGLAPRGRRGGED